MDTIFVLIADGQPLFSEVLASALKFFPGLVPLEDRPASSDQTLTAVATRKPDVVLIDYWIPGSWPPVQLLKEMRTVYSPAKSLFTSWLFSTSEIQSVLDAGATGFLPKSLKVADVASGIRLAYSGVSPVFGEELRRLADRIRSRDEGSERASDVLNELTPRELGILLLLASGMTTKEMAHRLSLSPATTRTHMGRLLKKTGCASQIELVALARHYGLVQL